LAKDRFTNLASKASPANSQSSDEKQLPTVLPRMTINQPDNFEDTLVTTEQNNSLGKYTIQLAAYNSIEQAREFVSALILPNHALFIDASSAKQSQFYRVLYGQFPDKATALNFANNNLPPGQAYFVTSNHHGAKKREALQANTSNTKNAPLALPWVIQLYASKYPATLRDELEPFKTLGPLSIGQKQILAANGQNETLYCIISQGFASKAQALQVLGTTKIQAWVTTAASYNKVTGIDEK
jgi:hypothetical protein